MISRSCPLCSLQNILARSSHASLLLQLLDLLAGFTLAQSVAAWDFFARLLRHDRYVPDLFSSCWVITRSPCLRVLDRFACCRIWVLRVLGFELVDLGRRFAFVHRGGIKLNTLLGSESVQERGLFLSGSVVTCRPLLRIVKL